MTYLCFQDKRAIKIIIETLRISKSEARVCFILIYFRLNFDSTSDLIIINNIIIRNRYCK